MRDEKLSVIEERMPPGTAEVAHYHRRSQQFFYILGGEASFDLNGLVVRLKARQGVHVPAGVPHHISNPSKKTLEFIVISDPPSHGDRVLPAADTKETDMSVYEKLEALAITLPGVTPPVAAFVPFVRSGNLIFLSGHIAKKDGKPWTGQLGAEISTADGKEAARTIAIDLMGTLEAATGNLDSIRRIVKLLVLVNSTPAFNEQHLVANGASELLAEVFGDRGKHARSAFGAAQIPFGSCVEIELIAEVADA
jgi:enamine deaminase RidA (YjgF/YER057c/UK114 family)